MLKTYISSKMSYYQVIYSGQLLITIAERDINKLAKFNFTAEKLNGVKSIISELKSCESDVIKLQQVSIASNAKNSTKQAIFNQMQVFKAMFDLVELPDETPVMQMFKGVNHRISDSNFLGVANNMLVSLRTYFSYLQVVGLTEAMITEFETNINNAETTVNEKLNAVTERSLQKASSNALRLQLLNELRKLCKAGYAVWQNTNSDMARQYTFAYYINKPKYPSVAPPGVITQGALQSHKLVELNSATI